MSSLRFQTKLMLAMLLAVAVVTLAILILSGNKVREAYVERYRKEFSAQVDQINESRATRSKEFLEISKKLAKHSYVVQFLQSPESGEELPEELRADFWKSCVSAITKSSSGGAGAGGPVNAKGPFTGGSLRGGSGPVGRGQNSAGSTGLSLEVLSKIAIIGVVDLEGNRYSFGNPQDGKNRTQKSRKVLGKRVGKHLKAASGLLSSEQQQLGFVAVENRQGGEKLVQEMVFSPVKSPGSSEVIGFFVRGSSAETSAERFLDRFQSQFSTGARLYSGIMLEDSFYSRTVDGARRLAISEALDPILREQETGIVDGTAQPRGKTNLSIDGQPYLVHFSALNPESSLATAWQVMLFPLAELHQDLRDLRVKGAIAGVVALVLGVGISLLLARGLTRSVRELSAGTQAIRQGDLDAKVQVCSGDELGQLAESFNEMTEELKQKALYREILGKVSDEAVAQAMISGTLDPELGGEMKRVSTLFCDIRGFTALTEEMHPSQVIDLVNQHMTAMTGVVQRHYGVVDKFVGDEIMAVFGALKNYGNDAANAAKCALEMVRERERLNLESEVPIHIGIGIATGEVVAGCMGSVDRLNYTVLGAKVNLAARLCGQAGPMEVVIDSETHSWVADQAQLLPLADLELKGFAGAVSAFQLCDFAEETAAASVEVL